LSLNFCKKINVISSANLTLTLLGNIMCQNLSHVLS